MSFRPGQFENAPFRTFPGNRSAFHSSKAEAVSEKDLARLWILEKLIGNTTEDQTPFVEKIDSVGEVQEIVKIIVADQDPNLMSPEALN